MTEAEAAKVVFMLIAAYPNAKTTEGTARLYEAKLKPLPAKACWRAVDRLIDTSTFLPSIAEIKQATARVRRDALDAQAVRERRLALPTPYGDVKQLLAAVLREEPADKEGT